MHTQEPPEHTLFKGQLHFDSASALARKVAKKQEEEQKVKEKQKHRSQQAKQLLEKHLTKANDHQEDYTSKRSLHHHLVQLKFVGKRRQLKERTAKETTERMTVDKRRGKPKMEVRDFPGLMHIRQEFVPESPQGFRRSWRSTWERRSHSLRDHL